MYLFYFAFYVFRSRLHENNLYFHLEIKQYFVAASYLSIIISVFASILILQYYNMSNTEMHRWESDSDKLQMRLRDEVICQGR